MLLGSLVVRALPSLPTAPASDPAPLVTNTEAPTDAGEVVDTLTEALDDLLGSFVAQLPLLALGLVVFAIALVVAHYTTTGIGRITRSRRINDSVTMLLRQVSRVVFFLLAALLGLRVAGFDVGSILAALGLAGLAVAFAVQSILENFIAGVLILLRRPFRIGDQVRVGDHEGTVEDVNLRVTRLRDYDGETVLVPNAHVLSGAIINLTERGRRRTRVAVGVDYRDDHDEGRDVLRDAVTAVEGVLATPAPLVVITQLGDSSVDFELLYWTAPDIRSVITVRDRVISAAKRALTDAGMTIPWPIRTLVMDDTVRIADVREGLRPRSTEARSDG
jgi:small-conductance mechanosensitive channel